MRLECVVAAGATLGEGGWWDDQAQRLWWVDITEGLIHAYDPVTAVNKTIAFGEPVGCLAPRRDGGLVVAAKSGFYLFDPATGDKTKLCDPEPHRTRNRFNDGTTDSKGRFWAGTMQEGDDPDPVGQVYRLNADHTVTPWRDNLTVVNGLAFSPDGRRLYVADTAPEVQTIWVCDYDPETGIPGEPRPFFHTRDLCGRPDGATVDAEGCYWVAAFDGWAVYRISPEGTLLSAIEMPVAKPTRPMFGGHDLDVLYVTSSAEGADADPDRPQKDPGGLFAVYDLGVRGVPGKPYAG